MTQPTRPTEGLPTAEQNAFIAQVYDVVFKRKETGSEEEIAEKIRSKVSQFFVPEYRQDSNDTAYDYEQFLCHVGDVNSRPNASFAIEVLANSLSSDGLNQVITRTVVTDTDSGNALSLVLSCWEFNNDRKLVRTREILSDPTDTSSPDYVPEPCGTLVDPTSWPANAKV